MKKMSEKMNVKKFEEKPFALKLDLQFFGGEEGEGGGEEIVRGGYNPDSDGPTNPLLDDTPETPELYGQGEGPEGDPNGEPNGDPEGQQPPEPKFFDFGGRKVDPNDPSTIEGAFKDFQEQQRFIQQQQEQIKQYQQMMEFAQQSMPNQQQQQQQQPQLSAEEIEQRNQELMDKFYDDPFNFVEEIKKQAVEEAKSFYEPIQKERQYQEEIQKVQGQYQDFNDFVPQMQELIKDLGEDRAEQIGLENIYHMAKGRSAQQQQPPSPDQLLNDPNFQQQIVQNEQIRNMILQNYANQKQQTNQQTPNLMGNRQGGFSPMSGEQKPRSIREAGEMLRKYENF